MNLAKLKFVIIMTKLSGGRTTPFQILMQKKIFRPRLCIPGLECRGRTKKIM